MTTAMRSSNPAVPGGARLEVRRAFGRPYYVIPNGLRGEKHEMLYGHLSGPYQLKELLPVKATADESGAWVASASAFLVHGDGDSLQDALADLRVSLTEYYELVEDGARGGDPYDIAELRRLRFYIIKNR